MTKKSMVGEALRLAEMGLRVFPLNGKTPIGGRGCRDATTDEYQIESWWERYPQANIGLATGKGIAVLDVDVRRDGGDSLRKLVYGHKEDFRTVSAKSGGGGRHFFFGVTKDMWVPNSKDRIGRGLEVLYDGRYVVAPPSVHPITGNTYEWVRDPRRAECLAMPRWLVELNVKESGQGSWDKYAEEIKEGEGRDNHLTSYAGSLRRGGATQGEIYDALLARNARVCKPPLSTRDLMRIARSVSRYKPEDIMVRATLDDSGNGERLANFVQGAAIFVPGVGWHTWSGRHWRLDEDGLRIQNKAKRVPREVKQAAADLKNEELSKQLFAWGKASGNLSRIQAMIKLASDEEGITTPVADLDRGDYTINLLNGTFLLKEGRLAEHKATDQFTKIARVEYDEEAECPQWEAFLEDVLPDPKVRDYVQRAIGYSLTGSTKEQCFFIMYGTGSNGKSTFVETIKYMMGKYAWKMASETIVSRYRPPSSASPDLISLRGPRFVVAAETGDGSRLNETVIKDLTGTDTMHARALYKSPIEFTPQFKLWMYSNYKPGVRGMDYGIWRRIRLIPFTATIEKPDKTLSQKLRTEMPGVFNWALRGYYEWEKFALKEPKVIRDEVKNYRADMDIVQQFVDERCRVDDKYLQEEGRDTKLVESSEELWEAFSKWQEDMPKSERVFRRNFLQRLSGLGFYHGKERVRGGRNPISAFRGLLLEEM